MKYLVVISASLLCSCQSLSTFHKEPVAGGSVASEAWRVEIHAAKKIGSVAGAKSPIYYKKLGLARQELLEAIDKVNWVSTSHAELCLPLIAPRLEIVQKQDNGYYLFEFFWEGGVGLLLRSKVDKRGNGFSFISDDLRELWRNDRDHASAREMEGIARTVVPKPEMLKFRKQSEDVR